MRDLLLENGPVVPMPDSAVPSPLMLRAALDQRRELLVLMPADKVQRNLRLDVTVSGSIVSGAVPSILQHREAIAAQFGAEGVAKVDDLQGIVYACMQAEVELTNSEGGTEVAELATQLTESHRYIVNELESLAFRKLIERARIDPGRPIQGYRQLVSSCITLIDLVRAILPQVAGKTSITMDELVAIEGVTRQMFETLNARERGTQHMPAAELRTRALSHLVSVYDQVRRMMTYVRWAEGDADEIAPSLYAARRGFYRSSAGSSEPGPSEPAKPGTPEPVTPVTPPMDPIPGGGPPPFTS